jgi:hypothetical protein
VGGIVTVDSVKVPFATEYAVLPFISVNFRPFVASVTAAVGSLVTLPELPERVTLTVITLSISLVVSW